MTTEFTDLEKSFLLLFPIILVDEEDMKDDPDAMNILVPVLRSIVQKLGLTVDECAAHLNGYLTQFGMDMEMSDFSLDEEDLEDFTEIYNWLLSTG